MTQGFVTDIPISTDTGLLPSNNSLVPSQLAVKTYVDNQTTGALTNWMQQGNNCFFWNLSFTHSAGTLTLAGADGTALSTTNPAYVSMPSNVTAGRMVVYTITANETLTVSDMTGNILGTTAAIAWGNSLPLYVGFMADASDANLEPVISRIPNLQISPSSSANIGDPASATADLETSVFAWNDITEANYQSKQLGFIGSLTATKAITTDAWTLDALTSYDGVGRWNSTTTFTLPVSQNGAESTTYFTATAGVEPKFATNNASYSMSRDGLVNCFLTYTTVNNTPSGAQNLEPVLPISNKVGFIGEVGRFNVSGSSTIYGMSGTVNGSSHKIQNIYLNGTTTIITNATFATSDSISIHITYLVIGSS